MRNILAVLLSFLLLCALSVSCVQKNVKSSADQTATQMAGDDGTPISISSIELKPQDQNAEIVISGSAAPKYTAFLLPDPPKLLIELHGVKLQESVPSTISGGDLVREIKVTPSVQQDENTVKLEAFLNSEVTYDTTGDETKISFILKPMKEGTQASLTSSSTMTGSEGAQPLKEEPLQSSSGTAESEAPSIEIHKVSTSDEGLNVSYTVQPPLTTVRIAAPQAPTKVKHFYLDNPARMVIDVYGVKAVKQQEVAKIDRPELSEVRVGSHPEYIRVVLQFPDKTPPNNQILENDDIVQVFLAHDPNVDIAAALSAPQKTPAPENVQASTVESPVEKTADAPVVAAPPTPAPSAAVAQDAVTPALPTETVSQAPPMLPVSAPETQAQASNQQTLDEPILIDFDQQFLLGAFKFIVIGNRPFPFYPDPTGIYYETESKKVPREFTFTIKNARLFQKTFMFQIGAPALTAVAVSEDQQRNQVKLRFVIPSDIPSDPIVSVDGKTISFQFNEPIKEVEYGVKVKKEFTGRKISLDFENAEITSVLRIISDVSGFNVIASDSVKGSITMRLEDIPWDQAFDVILQAKNLKSEQIGNVIRVITLEEYQQQVERQKDAKKALAEEAKERARQVEYELELNQKSAALKPLVTRIIALNYIDAADTAEMVLSACGEKGRGGIQTEQTQNVAGAGASERREDCMLSQRGSMMVDKHNNALIVNDTLEFVTKLKDLISQIDRPIARVLIEARIVEARTDLASDIGVKWGGKIERPDFTVDGRASSSSSTSTDGTTDGTSVLETLTNSVVDLPVDPSYGGLGINFGRIFGKTLVEIDAEITALEDAGKARVISAPRIMTMDNQEAVIKQGREFPVTTRTPDGTFKTDYRDAALKLTVVPRRVPNLDRLSLVVKLEEKEVTETTDVLGNPQLLTKEANTILLLDSGETMVIGGIVASDNSRSERRVPCLGTIPIVEYAFKSTQKAEDERELLMFITATIIPDENENKAKLNVRSIR